MKKKLNNKGFSLVELIVVIAIMAVLIGLLAPQFIKYVQRSKYSTDVKAGQEIATVVQTLIADTKFDTDGTDEEFKSGEKAYNLAVAAKLLSEEPKSKVDPTNNKFTVTYERLTGKVVVKCGTSTVYPIIDGTYKANLEN